RAGTGRSGIRAGGIDGHHPGIERARRRKQTEEQQRRQQRLRHQQQRQLPARWGLRAIAAQVAVQQPRAGQQRGQRQQAGGKHFGHGRGHRFASPSSASR